MDGGACSGPSIRLRMRTSIKSCRFARSHTPIYKAISRQVAHYAGHAYQILLIAKHLKGADWKTLSVPRGQSEEFNRRMMGKGRG